MCPLRALTRVKNMSSHGRHAPLHTSPSLLSDCYLPPPQLRKRIQEGPAADSCSADASETMPHANELDITLVGPAVTLPAALDPRAQAVDTSAKAQSDMVLALNVQSLSADGLNCHCNTSQKSCFAENASQSSCSVIHCSGYADFSL